MYDFCTENVLYFVSNSLYFVLLSMLPRSAVPLFEYCFFICFINSYENYICRNHVLSILLFLQCDDVKFPQSFLVAQEPALLLIYRLLLFLLQLITICRMFCDGLAGVYNSSTEDRSPSQVYVYAMRRSHGIYSLHF